MSHDSPSVGHEPTIPTQSHNSEVDVMERKHQVGTMENNRNYPRIKKQVENHTMGNRTQALHSTGLCVTGILNFYLFVLLLTLSLSLTDGILNGFCLI